MNYERISHTHCWDQDDFPPCGMPPEGHTQCCLCDLKPPSPIEVLKQRVRREFRKLNDGWIHPDKERFIDTLIDEVIATVEKEVVPAEIKFDPHSNRLAVSSSMNRTEGWDKARESVIRAFRTLKGEEK